MRPRYSGLLCAFVTVFSGLAIGCSDGDDFDFVQTDAPTARTHTEATPSNGARKNGRNISKDALGTPAQWLARLEATGTNVASTLLLTSAENEAIPVSIEDYYLVDGVLSMSGKAQESARSSFILKGDERGLYGWVVLNERNLAYEYTTDASGAVIASEVPVSKIYPVCNFHADDRETLAWPPRARAPQGLDPHIGEYDGSDLFKLQSLPGAKKVFYLKISDIMNGDTPKHFAKEEMWKTWQSVASTLSMFQVNVTTDPEVYDAAGVPNSGIACFLDQDGRSNAPLNSFGTTSCSSNYKNRGEGYGLGRIAAHEIGHQLGLSHDGGQPGGEYFEGFPEFKWTPLMGNIWPGDAWGDQALYQYSKGEYDSAITSQNDLSIVNGYLPFREDDIPDTKALSFDNGTNLSSDKNRGQIAENTDSDVFTFRIGDSGGHATLTIDRIEYLGGAMLDVAAELQDASGNVLAESNEQVARDAKFDLDLVKGDYKLAIRGGAEGTPEEGFSNYSSLGFYGITGTILGADSGGSGGMGGLGGSGGGAGTGGSSGGSGGVGGSSGAGGGAGSGGSGAVGGAGTGGSGGTGGSAGAGGSAGSGGIAGSGGAGAAGGGGAGGASGSAGSTGGSTQGISDIDGTGCGCHIPATAPRSSMLFGFAVAALAVKRRRRR